MEMKLWYEKPAKEWNEALPVGNGRLGGMVFGNTGIERIQLNEDSIWYGGPTDRNNPDAAANLPVIRKLLIEGRVKEAENLAALSLSGTPESQRHYQTMGELTIAFNHTGSVSSYTRELDLETAVVAVNYTVQGVNYSRKVFSSAADQVIVVRISSDQPGSITFTANLNRGRYLDKTGAVSGNSIFMDVSCGGKESISYRTMIRASAEGGRVYTLGDNLLVENANAVTLILSAETSFRHKDYISVCHKELKEASNKKYDELIKNHIQDYKSMYDRMGLNISGETADESLQALPTDERLLRIRDGKDDPGLVSLYFQFGRYLLISSSRPGTLPANLQGIWNNEMTPPWDSKYTININTEMNYWPAEVCNLSECHLPLFDLIERMREPGRRTAKGMYGCRGFVAHHNTDIWADTAPQDIYIPASYWPMGAAWLCLHLWEHYEYGKDMDFLREAYPVLKEAAEFFEDFLIEDSKGRLVTCPSVSPENTYILKNGEKGCLCIGPSMDSQILSMLFESCIQAAWLLECDDNFSEKLRALIIKLPKPQIGKYGQIQEWSEDYNEAEPGHRHISHLFGLYPGNLFTRRETPHLLDAAGKTLERRLAHGGGHTGWSRAWIINMWARLGNGEKSWENVMELLRRSTLSNLFDNHPPFQIDGNFGGIAGIAEMLLQSHSGEISLLPALPKAWANGKVHGLRARGGLELDMEWAGGKLVRVAFRSICAGTHVIRCGEKTTQISIAANACIMLDGKLQIVI